MPLILANRVKESCTSPGTGTVTLLGAATGYQTFSAGIGASNTTYYVIADQSGANWEVGLGTIGSGGTTLVRTTVLSSSNSNSLVNFASGTQDVFCDYPAEKAAYQSGAFQGTIDNTVIGGTTPAAGKFTSLEATGTVTANGTLLTGNLGTVTSVTGTAPVVSSGGTTPAISMAAANTTTNGYLTSTDWNTFNGKQATLVSGTNIKTVAGVSLLGSGDIGLIGGTYGGTGVNNGANTITVAGNLTHAGAFTQSFTATGNTAVTLPTSGTLISTVTNMAANPVTGTPSSSNFLRGDGTWASPTSGLASYTRTSFTATASQTTFTVTYTVGYLQVYVNGVLLNATDYTASNGTSVVLATGCNTGDIVETIAYTTTTVAVAGGSNTQVQYNSSGSLAGSANLTFDGTTLTGTFSGAHNGTVGAGTPNTGAFTTLSATTAIALTSGGTGKTTAPAAQANLMGYTTTATAAGTTTLTNTSSYIQYFTGTSAQTIVMPVTSTLATGWSFHIANNSTVALTLQSSGLNTIGTVPPQTTAHITCIGTALTTAADWDFGYTDFGTLLGNDGAVPMSAQWYLSAAGSALTGATQNVFGANSAVSLDAAGTYDIECYCYFLKTTAGTIQWIPTFSSAITVGHSYLEYTPVTGFTTSVITGAMVTAEATQQTTTVLTHTATASLTSAVYHIAKLKIRVTTNLACNFRLNNTIGTGSITLQAGSWYTARKVAINAGTFVA